MARPLALPEKQNAKLHRLIALYYYQDLEGDLIYYLSSYIGLGSADNKITPGFAWSGEEIATYVETHRRSIDTAKDQLYHWIEGGRR